MKLTNRQWTLLSAVAAALLLVLAIFGGDYRSLGIIFMPLCLWVSLKREPKQTGIRPGFRVLGWIFVALAAAAVVGSIIAISAGK
jgi:apolipoprotein N-acyltransferase